MLAVVVGPRPRVGAQDLQAATGIRQRVAAQLLPADRRVARAEPDIPLAFRRRDGDPVTAPGAHPVTSAGPESPSARAYCLVSALIRAVARQPATTSRAFSSMLSSAAADSAATSPAADSAAPP